MKLALGTVQFGTAYGVANASGQIPLQGAKDILRYAKDVGMDVLDTAASYGQSEAILGQIGLQGWDVITKLPPLDAAVADVGTWVEAQVDASINRLKVPSLCAVLLHYPADLLGVHGAAYSRALEDLRDSGKVRNVGVSIYSPDMLGELTKLFWPDVVQAPYNVLDQRIRASGWLEKLVTRGTRVHARSVFLQGLLTLSASEVPRYFTPWLDRLRRWHNVVHEYSSSPVELALNFVVQESLFDRIIVGIDTLPQLRELVKLCGAIEVPNLESLACDDPGLIEPYRWKLP